MSRSRRTVPPFDELSHDVWKQIVGATNNYDLLTRLLFPIVNQPLLRSHYSYTTRALVNAVSEHVLLAVCRLFDPKRDPRMASICNLLRGAPQQHAGDGSLSTQQRERRAEFDSELPRRLTLLKHRWETLLAIHRNAYLAHRDLTKLDALPPMKYQDIRDAIEVAQTYYAAYAYAYRNTDKQSHWKLLSFETEPQAFLEWCRLDNYQKHYQEDQRAQKARYYPPTSEAER